MPRRLWIFDFDGTLSPLVPDRERAAADPGCVELLQELAALPGAAVAVLSNRTLDDLSRRMSVPGVLLGGNGGVFWRTPDGAIAGPDEQTVRRLERTRAGVMPALEEAMRDFSADLEDKTWSVAVHTRNVLPARKGILAQLLHRWAAENHLVELRAPEAFEIPLSPGGGKARGIAALCRLLGVDDGQIEMCYAGDDESDIPAMEFVLSRGGRALSVGDRPLARGSLVARDQLELCRQVRRLASAAQAATDRTPHRP